MVSNSVTASQHNIKNCATFPVNLKPLVSTMLNGTNLQDECNSLAYCSEDTIK